MARTESNMLAIGTTVPSFSLPDVTTSEAISLEQFAGKPLLVMFICRHCPFVKHVQQEIARIGRDYVDKQVGMVAISSNDAEAYPDDAPPSLREMAAELAFNFPYCYDETQAVARAFDAACTPEFYLFDETHRLVYRGQLDDSRRGNDLPITGRDLRAALDAVLAGKPVSSDQKPSLGCNIKWRAA